MIGCDDGAPDPPTLNRTIRQRDASIMTTEIPDFGMMAGEEMGGALQAGEIAGTMGGEMGGTLAECANGDVRPLMGCGLERCVNGQWQTQQQSPERCNQHDDDCDGNIDEAFTIGGMCLAESGGCQVVGTFACDPMTEAAMCVPSSMVSSDHEACDGIDNDCDGSIDEDFDQSQRCCTTDEHCAVGTRCMEGICGGTPNDRPMIDPTQPLGTCGNPIWMPNFNVYPADGETANKLLNVANCLSEDIFDPSNLVLSLQSSLGSEVVFAFRLPQTQWVRVAPDFTLSFSLLYVFEGHCDPSQPLALHCDQSIVGLSTEPTRQAELTFEAQANTLYYVVLDTKADPVELLRIIGVADLGSIPYVLSFSSSSP